MIKIIEQEEIRLTQEEYDRLLDEYQKAMMFYAGPKISFETWVRRCQQNPKLGDRVK